MNFSLHNRSGNTLPIVLVFAAVGCIVVTGYFTHQVRSNTRALRSPAALQAILNARSGIYHALDDLISGDEPDTLETISVLDQLFRMDMFDDIKTDLSDELLDTDTAKTVFLYTNDSVNIADITIETSDIYCLITSRSTVLNITRTAEAKLGSPAPAKPDTILILENNLPVRGHLRGKVFQTVKNPDTSSKNMEGQIKKFISGLKRQNSSDADTSAFDIPLIIRSSNELASIPDIVKGHLLLDGVFSNVLWRDKRKVEVYGDLQITGFFQLENLEFSVGGEVRILDNASLANVYIFSSQSIFIGDNAVFHGNALSMSSINIYGRAEIKGQSSLIVAGAYDSEPKRSPGASPMHYSIFISETSKFDGVAIALGNPGGIRTERGTQLSGILWAQKAVCHNGRLSGIIRAEYLLDCLDPGIDSVTEPLKISENIFSGTIEPLPSIGNYNMPYFMGTPRIISRREY